MNEEDEEFERIEKEIKRRQAAEDDDTQEYSAQRQWVGLTDEQILAESEHWSPSAVFIEGAKWADAKLREKNGGAA